MAYNIADNSFKVRKTYCPEIEPAEGVQCGDEPCSVQQASSRDELNLPPAWSQNKSMKAAFSG